MSASDEQVEAFKAKLRSLSFPRFGDTKTVERANGAIVETHHSDGRVDATVKVSPVTSGTSVNGV